VGIQAPKFLRCVKSQKPPSPQTVGVTYAVETCREIQDFLISALLNEETSHPGGFNGQAKHNTLGVMNVMDGFCLHEKNFPGPKTVKLPKLGGDLVVGSKITSYKLQIYI